MNGNIVIFTDYFVHSLIDIVEESSLTVGLFCVSSYDECIQLIKTTPNLLGVLVVDWKPTKRTIRFYKNLLKTCDHISYCRESPMTLSILYKNAASAKVFQAVRTKNVFIYSLKLNHLTDEILKLDGIGPILSESQGLFNNTESYAINPSKIEFDSDYFNTVVFALLDAAYEIPYGMIEKHPLLRSIQNHRNGDLKDEDMKRILEHTPFSHIFKRTGGIL